MIPIEDKVSRVSWYLRNPKDGTELVLVPGGWFWMGSGEEDSDAYPNEKPRHLHYLVPFYLALSCITVAQFRLFVAESGHDAGKVWSNDPPEHPVRVNWKDAEAYCRWAGLRLPSEAEWELSARGYGALPYPWGADWEEGRRVCWAKQKGPGGATTPVDAHPEGVSRFGTYQQSGNVWEWCKDKWDGKVYQRYASGDFKVPEGEGTRVIHGASWDDLRTRYFRGAARDLSDPADRISIINGFRPARTVTF